MHPTGMHSCSIIDCEVNWFLFLFKAKRVRLDLCFHSNSQHTLIFCRYTVQYNRQERYIQLYKSTAEPSFQQKYHQLYGSAEITTRGAPLARSRFTGTKGPFLTPAPVLAIPDGNFSTLKSGVPTVIHQTWENASVPSQVKIISLT